MRVSLFVIGIAVVIVSLLLFARHALSDRALGLRNPFEKQKIIVPLATKDPVRELRDLLEEKQIAITASPVASDSSLLVLLTSGTEVFFSSKDDLALQVSSLQIIVSKLTIEDRHARRIDLRFSDPIVVY